MTSLTFGLSVLSAIAIGSAGTLGAMQIMPQPAAIALPQTNTAAMQATIERFDTNLGALLVEQKTIAAMMDKVASNQMITEAGLAQIHQDLLRQETERLAIRQQAQARERKINGDFDAFMKAVPK